MESRPLIVPQNTLTPRHLGQVRPDAATWLRSARVMHVFGGRIRSGVETFVLKLAEMQRDVLGEVILTPLADGPFAEESRSLGFTVVPLGKKRRFDVFSVPRLARIIKEHRVDIVHSHAINGTFYASPAGRMARVGGHVCHFHAPTVESLEDIWRWKLPRVLAYRYHLRLTRWCDRVVAVNPLLQQDLIRNGVPAGKVRFIPNGIDARQYEWTDADRESIRRELRLSAGATVVGTHARLAAFKNLSMFLDVAARLLVDGQDVFFVIAGDGPQGAMLKQKAARLGITDRVRFIGWRKDIPRVLAAFDIFVLTSTSEGFGLSMVEAMAARKPVVATDVEGPKIIVRHQQTGLRVANRDVGQMVDALRLLIRDEDMARRFGQAGRAVVEREFSIEALTRNVQNVYLSLVSQGGPSA